MKGISDEDYEHSQQVWNRITPEHDNLTLGDYRYFIWRKMFCCWQMYSRHSEVCP